MHTCICHVLCPSHIWKKLMEWESLAGLVETTYASRLMISKAWLFDFTRFHFTMRLYTVDQDNPIKWKYETSDAYNHAEKAFLWVERLYGSSTTTWTTITCRWATPAITWPRPCGQMFRVVFSKIWCSLYSASINITTQQVRAFQNLRRRGYGHSALMAVNLHDLTIKAGSNPYKSENAAC